MMPTLSHQKDYKFVNADQRQISIPKETTNPPKLAVQIGETPQNGDYIKTFLDMHRNYFPYPLFIQAIQGGGKTTFLSNLARDCVVLANQTTYIIDTIDYCDMSNHVLNHLPEGFAKEKIHIIDFNELDFVYPLFFTEIINYANWDNPRDIKMIANKIADQLSYLINTAIIDDKQSEMSVITKHHLKVCAKIYFTNKDRTVADFKKFLSMFDYRMMIIDECIERGIYEDTDEEIQEILSYSKFDKDGNFIGDDGTVFQPITKRLGAILDSDLIKDCFSLPVQYDSLDFCKLNEDGGHLVIFRLPQGDVLTPQMTDIIVTCLLSRLWTATDVATKILKGAKQPEIFNVFLDEINQHVQILKLMAQTVVESRRRGMHMVLSTHELEKLGKPLETFLAANCNFITLFSKRKNIEKLQDMYYPEYTIDEVMEILNENTDNKKMGIATITTSKKGKINFKIKLLKPLKDRYKTINRQKEMRKYLDECMVRYEKFESIKKEIRNKNPINSYQKQKFITGGSDIEDEIINDFV